MNDTQSVTTPLEIGETLRSQDPTADRGAHARALRFGHDFSQLRVHSPDRTSQQGASRGGEKAHESRSPNLERKAETTKEKAAPAANPPSPPSGSLVPQRRKAAQDDSLQDEPKIYSHSAQQTVASLSPSQLRPASIRGLQTKLTIGQPGDAYESEADRIANAVMSGGKIPSGSVRGVSSVQRSHQCACGGTCNKCRKTSGQTEPASDRRESAFETAPPIVHEVLRSPGEPLSARTRNFMETRFDRDFSGVRIHNSTSAAESASAVSARAYTVGDHIVFGSGQYAPGSTTGASLLAHELAHVLQQSSGGTTLQRKCLAEVGPTPPDCKFESVSATDPPIGERFLFNVNCDDFAPGEKARLEKLADPKVISKDSEITVLGMASAEGPKDFNDSLSCHRASAAVDVLTARGLGGSIRSVQAAGGVPNTEHDPRSRAVEVGIKSKPLDPCADGKVNEDKDPLPSVPPFRYSILPADQVFEKVKQMQPPGQPLPRNPPLGASQPSFPEKPVTVSTVPIPNSSCVKCVADWELTANWQALISVGPIDSDEPKRFAAFQQNNVSGCPFRPLPVLLPVRRMVTQAAVPVIIKAEQEHYNDFVRAFQLVGGRYLANVQRLTPERTHLRAKDQSECEEKVSEFLFNSRGQYFHFFIPFLERYTRSFGHDFTTQYNLPNRDRRGGPHEAQPIPPTSPQFQRPIFPNIDLDINPFGCKAFYRKYDANCAPGVPGPSSESIIKDTSEPLKQPWHQL